MPTNAHNLTLEQLLTKPRGALEDLLKRATTCGAEDVVALCNEALLQIEGNRRRRDLSEAEHVRGEYVAEYHFVCQRGRGVTEAEPGQFWSGSWVVSARNVERSIERGGILALHESKAQPSYRQGRILEFRRTTRDMIDKDNEGIEFLVEDTPVVVNWVGGGAGEKGYRWSTPNEDNP